MFYRPVTRACGGLLLLGLLAVSAGCGPNYKERATVKGKVTFAGKPLTGGTVMFWGKDNMSGTAVVDMQGNYAMADAPLGEVTITVTVPKPPLGPPGRLGGGGGPGAKSVKDKQSVDPEGSGRSIPIMGVRPSQYVPVSEKYAKPETSGLTYTVEKGEHTHDLILTP